MRRLVATRTHRTRGRGRQQHGGAGPAVRGHRRSCRSAPRPRPTASSTSPARIVAEGDIRSQTQQGAREPRRQTLTEGRLEPGQRRVGPRLPQEGRRLRGDERGLSHLLAKPTRRCGRRSSPTSSCPTRWSRSRWSRSPTAASARSSIRRAGRSRQPVQLRHPVAATRCSSPALVSRNGKDNTSVEGDMAAQTKAVLDNGAEMLKAAGMGFEHVVSSRVFITDGTKFQDDERRLPHLLPQGPAGPRHGGRAADGARSTRSRSR